MVDPIIIVAIISAASLIATTTIKVASDHLGKCKNEDTSEKTTLSAQSATAVSSPKVLKLNETLQSLDRRMDRMGMDVQSLQKRTGMIHAEALELDRRADEAIGTYGTNVQVTMLFHGLGSIFLQLNYPYFGTSVSVLMVVSFFSAFAVAYIISFNKIKKMSQWKKDLQRRQRELQNDIACFGAEIKRPFSDEELKTFGSTGALGEVWKWIDSLNRDARALQSTITGILEISSNSEIIRAKSLFRVAACAIIYGKIFPMMAYYLLSWGGLQSQVKALSRCFLQLLMSRLGISKSVKQKNKESGGESLIQDLFGGWVIPDLIQTMKVSLGTTLVVVAQLAETKTQLAESKIQLAESIKTDGILRLLEGRMERMNMEIQSLHRKISTLNAEQLDFEKRADEAISTYSSNVQLIMLVHCLGCVFLLVNFPYAGAGVSLVMVLSFFSVFINAYTVTHNKIERMSEFERQLLSRQTDLQNEVTCFGATTEAPFSNGELENFAKMGALNGLMECMSSMRRGAYALQKDITGIVELSSSKNIRMKSLSQVEAGAIIYGICFPILAYYFLCLVGFRGAGLGAGLGAGFSGTMQKY